MDTGFVVTMMRNAFIEVMYLAGPVLVVSIVVGLIISIFQATTSIQDQTLSFVPKIIAILLTIVFLGPWLLSRASEYMLSLYGLISSLT